MVQNRLILSRTIQLRGCEVYREYVYPNGSRFRIDNPETIYVLDDGGHRVMDAAGLVHRPERDFIGISWLPASGRAPFIT